MSVCKSGVKGRTLLDLAVVYLQNHEYNFAHSFTHLSLSQFREPGDIGAWPNRDERELENELPSVRTVLGEEQLQSEGMQAST